MVVWRTDASVEDSQGGARVGKDDVASTRAAGGFASHGGRHSRRRRDSPRTRRRRHIQAASAISWPAATSASAWLMAPPLRYSPHRLRFQEAAPCLPMLGACDVREALIVPNTMAAFCAGCSSVGIRTAGCKNRRITVANGLSTMKRHRSVPQGWPHELPPKRRHAADNPHLNHPPLVPPPSRAGGKGADPESHAQCLS